MSSQPINIFWFRRDLRLADNRGLFEALSQTHTVLPIFIFDENILSSLPKNDARVSFIHHCLQTIQQQLSEQDKAIKIYCGKPLAVWQKIIYTYNVVTVFANRDYEPYAQQRDKAVFELLNAKGIQYKGYKDHVIFEKTEILTGQNKPYTVFTPYANKWRASITDNSFKNYPSESLIHKFLTLKTKLPTLANIGFMKSEITVPDYKLTDNILCNYREYRDYPYLDATSYLGPHLRFGTVSVREVCRKSAKVSPTFLNEIIWRDFYSQVLYNHPRVVNESFKKKYDVIRWRNNKSEFKKWCEGKTGFPIVDAGMRQLNQTGLMHNRVRMIVASFLCKDLLIDWRWGEAYFAEKLLDYDLASNNGGWQWAASTGTDAVPYFRIFNPDSQLKKFDPELKYIKQWLPEFGTKKYPEKMVDHKMVRTRTLSTYNNLFG